MDHLLFNLFLSYRPHLLDNRQHCVRASLWLARSDNIQLIMENVVLNSQK